MVKIKKKKHKGVTLPEIMIAVAILGLVAGIVPNLITGITKFFRLNIARIETQRSARDSLNQINQNIRQAIGSTVTISQETNQPPSSSVSFTSVDGRWLKYYQSGKDLKFVNNTATSTVTDGLRYLAFLYPRSDDSSVISVSVTFEKDTYEGGTKALQMAIEKVRIMN